VRILKDEGYTDMDLPNILSRIGKEKSEETFLAIEIAPDLPN